LIIGTIVYYLFAESYHFYGNRSGLLELFSFKESWFPMEGEFQFLPLIVASFILAAGATSLLIIFSVPFTVGHNFLFTKRFQKIGDLVISMANAIPSVVYGFWGITIVVPIMTKFHFLGTNLLSGIIVLSFMLFPTAVLLITRVVYSWPSEIHRNCDALGLSVESKILKIYLPLIFKELPSVILLSFTRAIGETIAIVMVTGNIVKFPTDIFSPVRALTSNIALEMAYATGEHREALLFSGALILVIIFIFMIVFKGVTYVITKKAV
jgi:phosphate transport system permease protein